MKTSFNPSFMRDVKKIKDKDILKRLSAVVEEIEAAETLADIPNLTKLEGHQHTYRIRVGVFRLGIYCEDEVVELARFLHRKDIYRKFP